MIEKERHTHRERKQRDREGKSAICKHGNIEIYISYVDILTYISLAVI